MEIHHGNLEKDDRNSQLSDVVIASNAADISCSQLTDNFSTVMSERGSPHVEDNEFETPCATQDTDFTEMSISQSTLPRSLQEKVDKVARRKQRHIEDKLWAQSVKFPEDVEISDDGSSLLTIKGKNVHGNSISATALIECARVNGVTVTSSMKSKANVRNLILQHIKSKNSRVAMNEVNTKTSSCAASSHPNFIKQEGTIYRVILSLTCEGGKVSYANSFSRLNRTQIDSGLGHSMDLANNLAIYLDKDNEDLKSLGYHHLLFESAGISQEILTEYDILNLQQYCAVVKHVHYWYKRAIRENRASGSHLDFPNFVNHRFWLVLMYHLLTKTGNENLQTVAYPELPQVLTSLGNKNTPITVDESPKKNGTEDTKDPVQEMITLKRDTLRKIEKRKAMEISAIANDRYLVLIEKIAEVHKLLEDPVATSSPMKRRYKTALKLYEKELKSIEEDSKIHQSDDSSDDDSDSMHHE